MNRWSIGLAVAVLCTVGPLGGYGQGMDMSHDHHPGGDLSKDHGTEMTHDHAMEHGKTSGTGAYVPGLGDLMAAQQMRHAKLWAAGSAGNWPLAAYEVSELKEGFERIAALHPTHGAVDLTKLLPAFILPPLAELEAAIQKGQAGGFTERFDRLTDGCNACHRAAKHGFIVIQRPTAVLYSNQVFAPAKP
jgi:hypothetical protein